MDRKSHGSRWISYVLRAIEMVKFMKRWVALDDSHSGKDIKTKYIRGAFEHDNAPLFADRENLPLESKRRATADRKIAEALKAYSKKHTEIIEARRLLYLVYRKVRPFSGSWCMC